MRLRKECEHGRWEEHTSNANRYHEHCPGGEFLPEGALVIEKVEVDAFLRALGLSLFEVAGGPLVPNQAFFADLRAALDAVASQVRKTEA